MPDDAAPPRRETTLSLPEDLIRQAEALGVSLPQVCEAALRDAVRRAEKARRWQEENRAAIEAHSRWVEKHGLPLEKYRVF